MTTAVDPRIASLAAALRHHRALYYAGTPELGDDEFDALEDRLRQLAPDHPVLAEVGAPPPMAATAEEPDGPEASAAREGAAPEAEQLPTDAEGLARALDALNDALYAGAAAPPSEAETRDATEAKATATKADAKALARRLKALHRALLGAEPSAPALARSLVPEGVEWPKERHEIPMGSLNKVNSEDELRKWVERCDALAAELGGERPRPPPSAALSVSEKLDGLSIEIVYADGRPELAVTRGDGQVGERVTPNVLRMSGVPPRIPERRRISVRGEIVLPRSREAAYRAHRERVRGPAGDISLRNTAAGLARANKPDMLPALPLLQVYVYDVEGLDGLESEGQKLERLRELGFTTPNAAFGDVDAILEVFRRYAGGRRATLDYEIDGLVVRANDLDTQVLLGELNNRPRAAVAYKFESEARVTRLLEITWSTGDTGRITPVARVEGVRLAGARVEQASLHNAALIERLGVAPGDEVLVSRRNDVIPYVERVVVKGPATAEIPDACGACRAPVTRDGEYLVCKNPECPARRIGRIRTWIRHLDLLNWGEKTVVRLFEEGLVTRPADLYRLTVTDLTRLDGFGETSARALLDPLAGRRRIPLDTFIAALGVEGVSTETAALVVRAGHDDLARLAETSPEALAEIPGLGPIKARRVVDGIRERLPEIAELASVDVIPVPPRDGGPLAGLTFCFSGSHARPRKVLEGLVAERGGRVAASVTKGVDYLVLADASSTSSKAEKARKLGTQVIDEATFDALVVARGG